MTVRREYLETARILSEHRRRRPKVTKHERSVHFPIKHSPDVLAVTWTGDRLEPLSIPHC